MALRRARSLAVVLSLAACSAAGDPTGRRPDAAPTPSPASGSAHEATSASASASAFTPAGPPFMSEEVFALRITGGDVVDGTGARARRADVLVRGDRVAFVGDVDPRVRATRVLDAKGAIVTPGFIDMHSHASPLGDVEPALAQGVTTIVVGQDGVSSRNVGAWLKKVDEAGSRIHVATLVGHVTARLEAGVATKAHLGPDDRRAVARVVERGMDEGAFGLSTALEYEAGQLADADELAALARPVAARGGVVMSHLRSENDDEIDAAVSELVEQGRASGARVHVAHMKIVYGHGEARADALLATLAKARASGVDITADMYPYDASYTTIGILFPKRKGGTEAEVLAYLRERVQKRNGPEATLFGSGPYAGKTLAEAAKARGVPFERVLYDLGPAGAAAAYFVMDDALETRLLCDPFVSIGTDGGGGDPHPRSHGTFTRVFSEIVEKKKLLTVEEAVRKMTGLAAHTLGLDRPRADGRRGCLAIGCAADLDVFVPSELRSGADFVHPRVLAEGMRAVVVGGVVVREGDRPTRAKPGRALLSEPPAPPR